MQAAPPPPPPLPIVTVDRDNIEVRASCILLCPAPVADADGNGVVHVVGDRVTLDLDGTVLRGCPDGAAPEGMSGTGISVLGKDVVVRNGAVRGFKVAIHGEGCDRATFEGLDLSGNRCARLRSTPEREDGADWLWPHRNDGAEWRTAYGAALCIERADGVTVRGVTVHGGQNGIMLDRVTGSTVSACDASWLSGWGLALWRSTGNTVRDCRFDFCIRGHSHGVYNRGQDSAGILCFEQSSRNVFERNSATHCGDGFFGFAGREALGEAPAPVAFADDAARDAWYRGRGCNDNTLARNDFSFAAAHGIELTFSFGNRFVENILEGDAICGIWGGYSRDTFVRGNRFVACGDRGHGGERGGINAEHAQRWTITGNRFERLPMGIRTWWDEDAGIAGSPWARANGTACEGIFLRRNAFVDCTRDVEFAQTSGVVDEGGEGPVAAPAAPARPGRERIVMMLHGPFDWSGTQQDALACSWHVRAFKLAADPRTDDAAFRAAADAGIASGDACIAGLECEFGDGGPGAAAWEDGAPVLGKAIAEAGLPADRFGIAGTTAVAVPAGRWRIRASGDDGLRVSLDGARVIDRWAGGAGESIHEFALAEARTVRLDAEWFDWDGPARISVRLEPAGASK